MKFLLVNGYIRFPAYITKDGIGLLERPEREEVCNRLELSEAPQPSEELLKAVEGKYFERYSEAKAFLDELVEIENA